MLKQFEGWKNIDIALYFLSFPNMETMLIAEIHLQG